MTGKQQISTMIQWLTGHTQEWAATIWRAGGVLAMDYSAFVQEFRDVFDHPDQGQSGAQKLLHLCQSSSSVAEYAILFHIIVRRLERAGPLSTFPRGIECGDSAGAHL